MLTIEQIIAFITVDSFFTMPLSTSRNHLRILARNMQKSIMRYFNPDLELNNE